MPETMPRRFETAVAGVTFEGRQEALSWLWEVQEALHHNRLDGSLVREPGNAFDPNAIRAVVTTEIEAAFHVGYIPSTLAARLAPLMDAGWRVTVTAVRILRGGDAHKPGYGARLTLEIEEETQHA